MIQKGFKMKKIFSIGVLLFLCGCGAGPVYRQIENDLNSELAERLLDPEIKLVFGKHDVKGEDLGKYISNKKTYSFIVKTTETACQVAFLQALRSLQFRAKTLEATKITNIHSYYKKVPEWSDTTYYCQDGTYLTGVALRGTMVK